MDLWLKARVYAQEAAKRSQELTKDAARISQEFVSETAKKSKEMAGEAAKRAELIRSEARRAADQIKTISLDIPLPIPSALGQGSNDAVASPASDLERFGVTDELREFVQGIQISTFRDFPMQGGILQAQLMQMKAQLAYQASLALNQDQSQGSTALLQSYNLDMQQMCNPKRSSAVEYCQSGGGLLFQQMGCHKEELASTQ